MPGSGCVTVSDPVYAIHTGENIRQIAITDINKINDLMENIHQRLSHSKEGKHIIHDINNQILYSEVHFHCAPLTQECFGHDPIQLLRGIQR